MDATTNRSNQLGKLLSRIIQDRTLLALLCVIALAVIVRLFLFFQTYDQPVWYDEAEYLSVAKHWAFDVPFNLNPQRPPLFQALSALFFVLGFSEGIIKFLLVLLPSILVVFCIYLLGTELYSKHVGLVAAVFASVCWTFLFWSVRFQPDSFSLVFQVLAILFMWRHWKHPSREIVIFAGICAALAFYFKISALLVPLSFMIFILIHERAAAFKNKYNYIFVAAFIISLIPYFIWASASFGTPVAFKAGYSDSIGTPTPFGWYVLKFFSVLSTDGRDFGQFFSSLFSNPLATLRVSGLLVLFIIGLISGLSFLLYGDILIKEKQKCFNPHIFSVVVLLTVAAFYIFYIRGAEDRWVFLWMPFIFIFAAQAALMIYTKIQPYSKVSAIVILAAIIIVIAYFQWTHAYNLTISRKDSYGPVKDSGLWLKEHSEVNDLIWSLSSTQHAYYSERNVTAYNAPIKNVSMWNEFIEGNRPRYVVASIFEPVQTPWLFEWIDQNKNRTTVAQAYFQNNDQSQPILIIYEISY